MVQCMDAFVGRVQYSRYSLQYRVFSASHHLNTALVGIARLRKKYFVCFQLNARGYGIPRRFRDRIIIVLLLFCMRLIDSFIQSRHNVYFVETTELCP
jgi:hypothetical protein